MPIPANIFPLPFTPFEHFCYALARPQAAMTFWAVFIFRGRFHREIFQRSLMVALQRHPLFQALAQGGPERATQDISWVYAPQLLPFMDWAEWDVPIRPPQGEFIDLRQELGLRFFIRERDNETRMYVQTHHSCSDGLRFSEFFNDLLTIYSYLCSHAVIGPELRPVNPNILKERGRFRFGPLIRALMFPKNFLHLLRFFKKSIVAIMPFEDPKGISPISAAEPSYLTYIFNEADTVKLKSWAKSQGVSLNDFFLRDLFLSLRDWEKVHGSQEGKTTFRIAVPTDLAYALKTPMPSANKVGIIFLDRKIARFLSEERLLRRIHVEVERLRRWNLGYSFIRLLKIFGGKKGRLLNRLGQENYYPTMYFTTLGALFHGSSLMGPEGRLAAGNVELMDMDSIAPSVLWSPMNIIAASYAGRLKVCLRYNGQKVSSGQANEFLNLFIRRLNQNIQE